MTADIVSLWLKPEEFGVENEEAAFVLQYGYGVGIDVWEKLTEAGAGPELQNGADAMATPSSAVVTQVVAQEDQATTLKR